MPSDTGGSARLPSFRSAPSFYAAMGMGLLAGIAYLCRWPPAPPAAFWRDFDPGCYYRMAQQPFHAEHLPFVLRPAVPMLVRLLPVPTAWQFACTNVIFLAVLCALVERVAGRLGRPTVVRLGAAAVVCASNPVWKAFYLRAMVDLPVLCLIGAVVLLLLSERPRGAWAITVSSALAHPLGLFMSAGALVSRSWVAGISAGLVGAIVAGFYAFLMHPRFLPVAAGVAVGFKAALSANEPSPARALFGAFVYGLGPLVIGYLRAPLAYRRIILPATAGVLAALASGSDWTRLIGFLCPMLVPVALPSPVSAPGQWKSWKSFAWPIMAAVVLMALFLLPTMVPDLTVIRPNKVAGAILVLLSVILLAPWRLMQRSAVAIRLPT